MKITSSQFTKIEEPKKTESSREMNGFRKVKNRFLNLSMWLKTIKMVQKRVEHWTKVWSL